MNRKHIEGSERGEILIYSLSTCGWCRRAKKLLGEMGVAYDYIDVDQLQGDDKEKVKEEIKRHNPACSFPTILINDACIVGYKEDEIKGALSK